MKVSIMPAILIENCRFLLNTYYGSRRKIKHIFGAGDLILAIKLRYNKNI